MSDSQDPTSTPLTTRFILHWSHLKTYEECPRQFLWGHGWAGIDLGRGPGLGKEYPQKRSEHHALMGQVLGQVIEDFYNLSWWKTPDGLLDKMLQATDEVFERKLAKRYIEWGSQWHQAGTKPALLKVCRDGVQGFLATLKAHSLLGEFARAEVELSAYLDPDSPIGGRADIVIRRSHPTILSGVTILDGKNSSHKRKYSDPDQLRFYALCMALEAGTLPDRVGFLYFRFPYGMPVEGQPDGAIEQGVDWVNCTEAQVMDLARRAKEALAGMRALKFDPVPRPKVCKFCDFESLCEERQTQRASNSRKRMPKAILELEEILDGVEENGSGFVEL